MIPWHAINDDSVRLSQETYQLMIIIIIIIIAIAIDKAAI